MGYSLIFKSAEKIYGVKPNAIGDMRYITVPYSIAWLALKLDYKLDLYKIWLNQSLSDTLKDILHDLMVEVEEFIKGNAPGSLYGEWAKKEECWENLKRENFSINLSELNDDLHNEKAKKRKQLSESDIDNEIILAEEKFIESIPVDKWLLISKIGSEIQDITPHYKDRTINIQSTLRQKKKLSDLQRKDAIKIVEIILNVLPGFFDDVVIENKHSDFVRLDITADLLQKMVTWDTKAKVFSRKEQQYVADFAYGLKKLNDFHKKNLEIYLKRLQEVGFFV